MTTTRAITSDSVRTAHRRWPTLGERYSDRANGFGVLRLVLAVGVLVAHAWPLGYGWGSFGDSLTRHQTDIGSVCLQGFFVISGFLVTNSGLQHSAPRYVWYRTLRILPGLWICLLVTALGFAPLAAYLEHGNLDGFWNHPLGPWRYLATNAFGSMEQFPISGLLEHVPFATMVQGPSAFNGSLWSLHYEFACYALVAVLSLTAVLRRSPRLVLLLLGGAYLLIVRDTLASSSWAIRPPAWGAIGPFPLIGSFAANWTLYLGFLFLLGAAARLYRDRLPMHGAIAAGALVVVLVAMRAGGYLVFALPAIGYLVLYVAVALPAWARRIGRRRDYTYGVYVYAFPVQQLLVLLGLNRYGLPVYILATLALTFALAAMSWHLVESPAMRLKDIRFPLVRSGPAVQHAHLPHDVVAVQRVPLLLHDAAVDHAVDVGGAEGDLPAGGWDDHGRRDAAVVAGVDPAGRPT